MALVLALLAPAAAQEAPLGARPAGFAGAYSALADDAYAPVWNPAGLGLGRVAEGALLHGARTGGSARQSAALALPVGGRFGAGLALDFAPGAASYGAAAGASVTPRLAVGGALRRLDAAQAAGTAGDLAVMYRLDRRLSLAAVTANLGGRSQSLREGGLAPQARFGAGWAANPRLTWALEGVFDRAGAAGVRSGAEVIVWRSLSARAGIDSLGDGAPFGGFTAGFGLAFGPARLDFAAGPRAGGMAEQVSLIARFGSAERPVAALPEPALAPAPAAPRPSRARPAPVVARFEAQPPASAPAVSTPAASGFLAEPPQAQPRQPRAPEPAPKPEAEQPVQPGMIWLGQ